MEQISIKLPIRETAQVTSIKLPIRETAWVMTGFIISERIISWKSTSINLIENIRSRINIDAELIDKNHIKIKWFGEPVPKIQLYKKFDGEENYGSPIATLEWCPPEYTMLLDSNSYNLKLVGINNTGLSDEMIIGGDQDNDVIVNLELPINEKNYYIPIDNTSKYRIEVNF